MERIASGATRSSLPALILALLALGGGLFALAVPLPAGIAWLAAIAGAVAVLAGVALALHAALRRPDLLRTETHSEITRPATPGQKD